MDHLYEAVLYIAAAGFANGREVGAVKMVQQIVQWSATKSRLVNIRGQVEAARLAALVGDIETAAKQSAAATTLLLPKQVVLPRAEAAVRYSQSKVAFMEGNIADGINKLFESISYLRGNERGIGSPALFQLDLVLQLGKSKAIPEPTVEGMLVQLLKSPTAGHWRIDPLEQLDWLMVDKSEASTVLLDIQLRTRDESEIVRALDDVKRKSYRKLNELESRVFDLQMILHGDNRFVGNLTDAGLLRNQLPILDQNVSKIRQLIAPLVTNPKWDLRRWSDDETRRWESAVRLSASQESMLWAAAISPVDIAEVYPPLHSDDLLAKSLRPTDAVVHFASLGSRMRGSLFVSGKWQSWEISDFASLESKSTSFLGQLLAFKNRDGEAIDVMKKKDFARRLEIRNQLFPKEIWARLAAAGRWIIVPDGGLWNLPFEIFPLADLPSSLPCISEHCITYSPTLGLVPYLLDAKPIAKTTRGVDMHVNDFLSLDSSNAKELREELSSKKRFIVNGSGKPGDSSGKPGDSSGKPSTVYPSSRFFKVTSDCISAYSSMNWDSIVPIPTDPNLIQSNIRFWGRLPWGTPSTILLPGVNASQATGDEWLRLTLPLIAQGTRQLTVSRWSVGGESTASLMRSFQENQEDLSVSESWQRSVLTLWEEQFETRNEPLFKGATSTKSETSISGSQPLLWSGYLRIGDSR